MSSRRGKSLFSRKGLWLLVIGPLLFLVGGIVQSNASGSFRQNFALMGDIELLDGSESWQDLPGFSDEWRLVEGGLFPEPTANDRFEVDATDTGFAYTITYESGATYQATYSEIWGDAYYFYEVPERPILKWLGTGLMVAAFPLTLLGIIALLYNLRDGDPGVNRLAAAASGEATTPLAEALITRWLQRSRHYRLVGSAMAAGAYLATYGSVILVNDLLLWMVAGMALGGTAAELHLIGRKSGRTAVAGLSSRRFSDYAGRGDLALVAMIAAAAAVVGGLSQTNALSASALWPSLLTLMVLAGVLSFQRLVVSRPRPALNADIRQADDLLRHLAVTQGFARPGIAVALFLLYHALGDDSHPTWLNIAALAVAVAGLGWLVLGRQSRIPKMANKLRSA